MDKMQVCGICDPSSILGGSTMNNTELKKENLVIYADRWAYVWALIIPVIIWGFELNEFARHDTKISLNFLLFPLLIYIILAILCTKIIKVNKTSIIYWSSILYLKKIPLNKIDHVEVDVVPIGSRTVAGVSEMHIFDKDSKKLMTITLQPFYEKDQTLLFKKITSVAPAIKLDAKAEAIKNIDFEEVKSEIKNVYYSSIGVLFQLAMVVGLIFLILKFVLFL